MSLEAQIQKRAGAFTLDVSVTAEPGITVLFGRSGSGKSLTLNSIGGFVKPDAGRITLDGSTLFDSQKNVHVKPERRRCPYMFQDHALFPHMTVRENLSFAASLKSNRQGRLQRYKQISVLLERFRLTPLADRKGDVLSGGERQRAALARVLLTEARLLLLDEPARGLDQDLREDWHGLLQEVCQTQQLPILLVTHDPAELYRLADTVYLYEEGRILAGGPASAILFRPPTTECARLLGNFNLVAVRIQSLDPSRNRSVLVSEGMEIAGPYLPRHLIGDKGTLCFRTDALRVEEAKTAGAWPLEITSASRDPHGFRYTTRQGVDVRSTQCFSSQSTVWVSLAPEELQFLD